MPRLSSFVCSLVILTSLCGCDSRDPVPFVEILSVKPSAIVTGNDAEDDLRIEIHYIDGDGDLGGGEAAFYDCRADAEPTRLIIPPVASDKVIEEGLEIDGTLFLFLSDIKATPRVDPSVCAPFGAAKLGADELSYCTRLSDAAGNLSEPACSEIIAISE